MQTPFFQIISPPLPNNNERVQVIYLQIHCGIAPVHDPVSSQLLIGSPTTLYPRSQRYLTNAPILYVDVDTVSDEVRIRVRPYKRSLPVTDKTLCSGKIGSGHLISLQENELHMKTRKGLFGVVSSNKSLVVIQWLFFFSVVYNMLVYIILYTSD